MTLYDILVLKFPEADFLKDIILEDRSDGNGPYIREWNLDIPSPTAAELSIWEEDVALQYSFNANRIANKPIYDQLNAIDARSIRALRVNDLQKLQELEEEAIELRLQLLPTE